MAKSEQIPIIRHMNVEHLIKQIKRLEKDTMVLQRLFFIKHRYDGMSVEEAAKLVGASKNTGYLWQKRWNEQGYDGLIPQFAGGRPSNLTDKQKKELRSILGKQDNWTTKEVQKLISKKFGVDYTLKQIRVILKKFGMNYAKPYQHDYRKPKNAEDILKKPP
jgi:putative transposase